MGPSGTSEYKACCFLSFVWEFLMMDRKEAYKGHVVALSYHHQGHANTMIQFCKRLASKGLKITITTTKKLHHLPKSTPAISFHQIFDDETPTTGGVGGGGYSGFVKRLEAIGSINLTQLIRQHQNSDHPIKCIVYDAMMPWVFTVAEKFGLPSAAFFTQSCTAIARYYPMFLELSSAPALPPELAFPITGLPQPKVLSIPSCGPDSGPFHPIILLQLSYYNNVDKADWVLFNSFDILEREIVEWMSRFWAVRMVGPNLPSFYLDKRVQNDDDYGFYKYTPKTDACIKWLDGKPIGSVVYVSFGSAANLSRQQIEELVGALLVGRNGVGDDDYFLWVVRPDEESKLPNNFTSAEKGLVVSWCSQLAVLAHPAVGCFVSHCGWSSTMEAISLGVPVVAMPQFLDQMTNAHFIDNVWGVGVEAKADDEGLISGDEIRRCIDQVMHGGETGEVIKTNVTKWKELAKEAADEGGSSDKYIDEIVAKIVAP